MRSVLAIACFLIITCGSYRIGRTVADSYWKAKVQNAIERTRDEIPINALVIQTTTAPSCGWGCISGTAGTASTSMQCQPGAVLMWGQP
jgi:hypothetical protein